MRDCHQTVSYPKPLKPDFIEELPSWSPGNVWRFPVTGGPFHFLPWLTELINMHILIAGTRTKERQTREPQEKQPRSSRKQRLKLHLCEQVTLKIAQWFLERNRWHFTCQQRVPCNRKTSKRPLHCHSLMDLRKQLTLVEKKGHKTQEGQSL